jgi:uncharacterized damage-inducible protein DinB
MRVMELQGLYDYSCWANTKLFDVMSELSQRQFTENVAGSYGSIRNTLVHVLSAEWGWLDRCGGPPRGDRLKAEDFHTAESVRALWRQVEDHMRAFLTGLTNEDLSRQIAFAPGNAPKQSIALGELLQHAIVHAVHHRGQVALLVRMLGYTPGNFDMLIYSAEKQILTS